jgi:hypothetical protein
VIELLTVNRLCDPESELGVHQRWYGIGEKGLKNARLHFRCHSAAGVGQ